MAGRNTYDPLSTLALPARYLIGEFEIEPGARRFRRSDGTPVHLANRPFRVLLYLVANRERLVTRSELLDKFWDGRTVYEDSLTRCVSSVRKALDDQGSTPRYIETRWAEGYRFIGACEEHHAPPTAAARAPAGRATAAELEEALALTGAIYDAALDPDRWPDTLRRIAGFVGGVAAALTSQDFASQTGRFHYSWGDDPRETRLYFEKYVRLNPVLVPMLLLAPGEVRSVSTVLPTEKFRTTRFYKEWAGPAGYGDNTAALIEKSATVITYLGVAHRDADSPVDAGPRRRLELITPHIRRAVAIGNLIERQRMETDALADAVDTLAAGVFLVREDGRVVHANASGRAMLGRGHPVRVEDGALAADGDEGRALAGAIAAAIANRLVIGHRGAAIDLPARDGARYVAHVLPLAVGRGRPQQPTAGTAAAVFVHAAGPDGVLPLELFARRYGLSVAELRVLVAMIEVGGRAANIAPVLGIAAATVDTHLRRLYAKAGTRCEAELIELVAAHTGPPAAAR